MNKQERRFIKTVWDFYRDKGRHDLPWRRQSHLKPYNILVSELMLQQTQVDRVIPKYQDFIKKWGSARALASAPLGEVLRKWQGLGYNRRAKFLHQAAREVVTRGKFPNTYNDLKSLSGVGEYTAGAIMAFAYTQPVPIIETNIRTVYIHHFFKAKQNVSDAEVFTLVEKTLDDTNPRQWYWALMDYGSHLKKEFGNNISRSKQYKKQSKFHDSDRQIRGAILRQLHDADRTKNDIESLDFAKERVYTQLTALVKEGLVEQQGNFFRLPL